MRGTKLLLGMLVSLVMIMAAMPAIACDQCTRDVPVFSMADVSDMIYQPVMATNEKINMPSPSEVTDEVTYLVNVATLTDTKTEVESNARDVRPDGEGMVGFYDVMRPNGDGGDLLRQGGEPMAS